MGKVLHILASPRGESYSTRVAKAFLEACRQSRPGDEVETLNLYANKIPVFEAPAAEAKHAVMAGLEPKDAAGRAWKRVIEVVVHFKSADLVLISCPMWNFGVPYRLKQYIDVIVQPGLTFSYSPQEGYKGMVTGRPAVLILARGGAYPEGTPWAAWDMQRSYLELVLRHIGFTDIRAVVIEPTLQGGPQVAEEKVQAAISLARRLAKEILPAAATAAR